MKPKRPFRLIVTQCAVALLSPAIFAQTSKTITGTVTGQGNAPLAGATVSAKGSKAVTATDAVANIRMFMTTD